MNSSSYVHITLKYNDMITKASNGNLKLGTEQNILVLRYKRNVYKLYNASYIHNCIKGYGGV